MSEEKDDIKNKQELNSLQNPVSGSGDGKGDGDKVSQGRRDVLKAMATVPVLGAMAYGVYRKKRAETVNRDAARMFRFQSNIASYQPPSTDVEVIRVGIIGFGIRGAQLMQALGFATPQY